MLRISVPILSSRPHATYPHVNSDVGDLSLADLALVVLESRVELSVVSKELRQRRDLEFAVWAFIDQPIIFCPGVALVVPGHADVFPGPEVATLDFAVQPLAVGFFLDQKFDRSNFLSLLFLDLGVFGPFVSFKHHLFAFVLLCLFSLQLDLGYLEV